MKRNIVKVALGNLVLISLLSGCGNMVDSDAPTKANGELVESIIAEESELSVTEQAEETAAGDVSEDIVEAESKTIKEGNLNIEVNSGSQTTEAQEYEELYITYEDMEPTTMYVILYCDIYPDVNETEGVLEIEDSIEAGEEVIVDGKGTFDGDEFYRIQRPEDSMNPYSSILPARALSLEKPVEVWNEAATESDQRIIFNGATVTMEAKEYEEKYITYEDMEPTTMYAIRYSEMYPDLNASEGVLRMDGCVFVGDEVTIDGKGTYDGVEYYRIKRPENCFNPYSSILPADALSPEKPVQQSAVEQTVEPTIMTVAAPAEENVSIEELVGADVYAGLSEAEKRDLDRMFNYDGQIPWAEDPNADVPGFSCERNENGGFTIIDPNIPPEILEKAGRLIVY